jgi:MFS transporter, AAHS family, 4-hydroxybenzoate transporter
VRGVSPARLLSGTQWLVLALILAVFLVDGMDTQMMAVALPSLSQDWQLAPPVFAIALAMGHAGGAVGGALGGLLGDRIGRRNALIICAILFGVMSISLTLARDVWQLALLRVLCGLGLGGAVPPAIALLTEFFSPRLRSTVIALAFLCSPLGIATAGLLAATVMPWYGWQGLFLIAGLAPLALTVLLVLLLPVAASADTGHSPEGATERRTMRWRNPMRSVAGEVQGLGALRASSIGLFGGFFFAYAAMSFVLTWLPTMLTNHHFSLQRAGLGVSVWSVSGMVGIPLLGWAAGRRGVRYVATRTAWCGTLGACLIALSATLDASGALDSIAFYVSLGFTGALANGLMILLYSLAAENFPVELRSTGLGLAATAGRIGAIASAYFGGRALQLNGVASFFLVTAALLLSACVSFNLSGWKRSPSAAMLTSLVKRRV